MGNGRLGCWVMWRGGPAYVLARDTEDTGSDEFLVCSAHEYTSIWTSRERLDALELITDPVEIATLTLQSEQKMEKLLSSVRSLFSAQFKHGLMVSA